MAKRVVEGQLALDLFSERKPVRDPERWVEWLVRQHGVGADGAELARRVFAELPWLEATERCGVAALLSGSRKLDGYSVKDADLFGTFDLTIDYHVCWDRQWAAKNGVPKERIADIVRWDYGKKAPVFGKE